MSARAHDRHDRLQPGNYGLPAGRAEQPLHLAKGGYAIFSEEDRVKADRRVGAFVWRAGRCEIPDDKACSRGRNERRRSFRRRFDSHR
jgi:hypothetical protein